MSTDREHSDHRFDRVERLLDTFFFILNQKANTMTQDLAGITQDVADLATAVGTENDALVTLVNEVTVAISGLDALAKAVADAVAGAADFTALSNQIKAVKQSIVDATGKAAQATLDLSAGVTRDVPAAPAPAPVVDPVPAVDPATPAA